MKDIKPRMVDGVGYCSMECPQFSGPDHDRYDGSCPMADDHVNTGEVCPVWAQRIAAWAEEAREVINEYAPEACRCRIDSDTGDLLRQCDMCRVALSYPGKDGE